MSELQKIRWSRVALLSGLCIGLSTAFGTLGALAVSRQWTRQDAREAQRSEKRIQALEHKLQSTQYNERVQFKALKRRSLVTWEQWSDLESKRLVAAKKNARKPLPNPKSETVERRIDIDLYHKDLRAIVSEIGRKVGRNILLAPGIEETLTIELRDINWVDALKIVAKQCRCEITMEAGEVILLTQPARVTIEFSDANVRTVLMLLAAYTGKNIVLDPKINGYVSLSLKDVHWEKAIQAVCAAHGDFVVFEDHNSEILIAKARPRKGRR